MSSIETLIQLRFSHKRYQHIIYTKRGFCDATAFYGTVKADLQLYGIHFNPRFKTYYIERRNAYGAQIIEKLNHLEIQRIPEVLRNALVTVAKTNKTMLTPPF